MCQLAIVMMSNDVTKTSALMQNTLLSNLVFKFATNFSGAILLPSSIQVTESISGSVVPLAMFFLCFETNRTRNKMRVAIESDKGMKVKVRIKSEIL